MRKALLLTIVLGLVVAFSACQRDAEAKDCLENPLRTGVMAANEEAPRFPAADLEIPNGTTIDARGLDLDGSLLYSGKYAYRADSRQGLCIVGGNYFTTHDRDESPWTTIWHKRWGLIINNADATIVGPNLYNTGDGIMFESGAAKNWSIIGANASGPDGVGAFIHDDCIENDYMNAGRVIDSKFDGCHVFLSMIMQAKSGAVMPDGSASDVVVDGSLVRLQPMKNSFNPDKYGYNRHGGFFKLAFADEGDLRGDGTPARLVLSNSIFRSDEPAAYGGNTGGKLGVPEGTVCTNVTIVGWETWPAAEVASWEKACGDELHKGSVADWDAEVAAWDAANPRI